MALVIQSPNMNMPIPQVGQEPGPDWASDLNNSLTIVDSHDHTSGKGLPITPSALNINTDLSFNNNAATFLSNIVFQSQTSSTLDVNSVEVIDVDLYFRDGNNNLIRITQAGGVAGTSGSIAGLVSPASVTYNAFSQTFIWQADVNVAANMDAASLKIRRPIIASSPAVTLQAPTSISGDYVLALPLLPSAKKIMTLDNSGNLAADYDTDNVSLEVSSNLLQIKDDGVTTSKILDSSVTTSKIADANITTAKIAGQNITLPLMALANYGGSVNSSTFTTTSTSFVNVGIDLTFTPTVNPAVRPIIIALQTGNPANNSLLGAVFNGFTAGAFGADFRILRDGTPLSNWRITTTKDGSNAWQLEVPVSQIFIDASASMASHTYALEARSVGLVGTVVEVTNAQFTIMQL